MKTSVIFFTFFALALATENRHISASETDDVPDAIIPDPIPTILGLVLSQPDDFTILAKAVSAVPGLPETLDNHTMKLTVFAPTDAAFTALTRILLPDEDLDPEDKDDVFNKLASAIAPLADIEEAKFSTVETILAYHVLGKQFPFQKLEKLRAFKALQGDKLRFKNGKVIDLDPSRDNAIADPRNIFTQNGWVHVLDSVLLPFDLGSLSEGQPTAEMSPSASNGALNISEADGVPDAIIPDPRPTIFGLVASDPEQFGVLGKAVASVEDLPMLLDDPSSRLTVFAPTDEAFTALANQLAPGANLDASDKDGVLETLVAAIAPLAKIPEAKFSTVASILKYHAIGEALSFQKLEDLGSVETLQGAQVSIAGGSVIDKDRSRADPVADPRNLLLQNGWVHVVDSVLLPFNLRKALQATELDDMEDPTASPAGSPELDLASPSPSLDDDELPEPSPTDDGVCFPGSATVRLADGSATSMNALNAGDEILVGDSRTSPVFAFTHKMESKEAWFYSLVTASGHKLKLTGSHYLYANGVLTAAEAVRIGDFLQTNVGKSQVVTVRRVKERGLFAPHTIHGDIEVDGVLVSGYSRALHPTIAHGMLAPVRMLAKYMGVVEPLGSLFYEGADVIVPFLPKGPKRY